MELRMTPPPQNEKKGSEYMENYSKEEKDKLILAEKKRLVGIYKDIEVKRKSTINGLIERAAFMRISLDELEKDLNTNGFVELFSQGEQDPYERKRPTADIYNQINNSYQKLIKQLTDLLPKEPLKISDVGDAFDSFIQGREDV